MKGRVILIDMPEERASQAALLVDGRLDTAAIAVFGQLHTHEVQDYPRRPLLSEGNTDRERDARFVGEILATWAERYVEPSESG